MTSSVVATAQFERAKSVDLFMCEMLPLSLAHCKLRCYGAVTCTPKVTDWRTPMSATMSPAPLQDSASRRSAPAPALLALGAWLAAVLMLGANDAFLGPRGAPPIALLIGFA